MDNLLNFPLDQVNSLKGNIAYESIQNQTPVSDGAEKNVWDIEKKQVVQDNSLANANIESEDKPPEETKETDNTDNNDNSSQLGNSEENGAEKVEQMETDTKTENAECSENTNRFKGFRGKRKHKPDAATVDDRRKQRVRSHTIHCSYLY